MHGRRGPCGNNISDPPGPLFLFLPHYNGSYRVSITEQTTAKHYIVIITLTCHVSVFLVSVFHVSVSVSVFSRQPESISIGNYTVREVLMKNRTRVWRNVYNIINISPNTSEIFH